MCANLCRLPGSPVQAACGQHEALAGCPGGAHAAAGRVSGREGAGAAPTAIMRTRMRKTLRTGRSAMARAETTLPRAE